MIRLDQPLYAEPTLRPCNLIESEPGSGIRVGLAQRYSALTDALPLVGASAMRVSPEGNFPSLQLLRTKLPWMERAIMAVERHVRVALWAGRPWLAWPPICLVGDPGSGKSHFARELASLSELPSAALDLGAMYDAAALTAVSRGWTNTKPCWPAQMMAAFRTANPLLVLGEIEKAGGSARNGEPHKALLAMFEPISAARYFDTCLMTEVDLSAVCWIATANSVDRLPPALISRMEVVFIERPGFDHFEVALEGILTTIAVDWGLPRHSLPDLPQRAVTVLRLAFGRHRSIRSLKRNVQAVIGAILPSMQRRTH